ncbi:MAG: hypothetical protein ACPLPR_02355 [Bacillota bacterium]
MPRYESEKEDSHIRPGIPEDGENLKARYRSVLVGAEFLSFSEEQLRAEMFNFEDCLADLKACLECKADAVRVVQLKDREGNPEYEVYLVSKCRTIAGNGFYKALDVAGSKDCGRPVFRMYNCPGPVQRKKQIRDAWITTRFEPPKPAVQEVLKQ